MNRLVKLSAAVWRAAGLLLCTFAVQAQEAMPAGVIKLDETVISGNQELPKVLYIVPWQQPDGLPDIELSTEFSEVELFRRLYPPAYRREIGYYEATQASQE